MSDRVHRMVRMVQSDSSVFSTNVLALICHVLGLCPFINRTGSLFELSIEVLRIMRAEC